MFNAVNENLNLKIFTWHIHGSYLYNLSQGDYTIYIPVNEKRTEGYYGRGNAFPFGENVIEIPAEEVKHHRFDCILFQTNKNFFTDQYDILSDEQRKLPRIYLEHDPPQQHPTNTRHPVNDSDVILVHVTHFNKLMWESSLPVVKVIEHGVVPPVASYSGELERGVVVVNHLHRRGRRLGLDVYEAVSRELPVDLVGMGTKEFGGLGEVPPAELASFISRYRFFFNPIRYTSFGLAVCEAMMCGMPIVALATTEYATVFRDGENGFVHTDISYLIKKMHFLLDHPKEARLLGQAAKKTATVQFNIERFTRQWKDLFLLAIKSNNETHEEEHRIYQ